MTANAFQSWSTSRGFVNRIIDFSASGAASLCVFVLPWNTRNKCFILRSKLEQQSSSKQTTQSQSQSKNKNGMTMTNVSQQKIEFQLHSSISSIPAEAWNSCLAPDGSSSPFLEHAWLQCLEESGCASPEIGWVPQHVSAHFDGRTKAFAYVPMYIKGHSMGEFIFDNGWADAAYQNSIDYYPKLLVGVPFTPATGGKILFDADLRTKLTRNEVAELRIIIAKFLKQIALSNKISSVHLNFITDQEAYDISGSLPKPKKLKSETTTEGGRNDESSYKKRSLMDQIMYRDKNEYLRRTSMQYHWTNCNVKNDNKPYTSFEEYLECFKSKRRITIRRERRKVMVDENILVDAIVGKDILKFPGLVERMFHIYKSTIDKLYYGRQYLSLQFFEMLVQSDFVENLVFMCARLGNDNDERQEGEEHEFKAQDVFAGTFNIVKNGVFYGRYWGCLPGRDVKNLHFEVCYWSAIDYCIRNGLQRMEPGAGGGDYKWARGFDPALIHSAHYICHPGLRRAVHRFLDFETENNVEVSEYLLERSAIKNRVVGKEKSDQG